MQRGKKQEKMLDKLKWLKAKRVTDALKATRNKRHSHCHSELSGTYEKPDDSTSEVELILIDGAWLAASVIDMCKKIKFLFEKISKILTRAQIFIVS